MSNQAPRAAVGPDLIGAIMAPLGAAQAEYIAIRVFSTGETRECWFETETHQELENRIQEEMRNGCTFCIEAEGHRLRMLRGVALPEPIGLKAIHQESHDPGQLFSKQRFNCGHNLNWALEGAIERAMKQGARLIAAPFMGRLGVFIDEPNMPETMSVENELFRLRDALCEQSGEKDVE